MARRRCRRPPSAVACSAASIAATSGAGSRSRRPTTLSRTACVASRGVSVRRWRAKRRSNAATSLGGRLQLSAEKAYSVSARSPRSGAASTTRRTACAPARWPAARGRPRRVAQRPLPSMMIATWREVLCFIKSVLKKRDDVGLALTCGADQRFHVIEVALQRPPPRRGEPVFGFGHASRERLGAGDVLRLLELAGVHAEVAVAGLEECFQLAEGEARVHRERADDAEADPLVNQPVELGRGGLRLRLHGALWLSLRHAGRSCLSHRTSVR